MAVGVLRVLSEHKISVPEAISIVGLDDIHHAEFANPPLSTARMAREDIARGAFKALERLRDRKPASTEPHLISTRLVPRQSTAPESAAARNLKLPQR
jgi:LacI family transcriptional regulator